MHFWFHSKKQNFLVFTKILETIECFLVFKLEVLQIFYVFFWQKIDDSVQISSNPRKIMVR